MSRKLSLILFITALISAGLVILTGINNARWDKSASYGQYYFDGLKSDLNNVALIRLSQSGESFEIEREGRKVTAIKFKSTPRQKRISAIPAELENRVTHRLKQL